MKKIAKQSLMVAFAAALGLGAAVAQAQTAADRVYVIDQRGEVATSGTGLCWRTGFWTPAGAANDPAGCKCDKDLLPKEKCEPKTAGAAGGPKPASSKVTLAADALFDYDKAVLRPEGKKSLDDLVAKSKSLNLEVIIAVGHTDRLGSDAYNQKLSEKRAAAVKTYLVSKGVEANKVYTEGKGEKQPKTGATCKGDKKSKALIQCLQPDRRVDIEIIGTQK
jgi:OOP family OmpA-OmpF porin